MAVTFSMKAPASILAEHGLSNGAQVQQYIDKEILRLCEPYVPRKSGALIASGYSATACGSGNICYNAPYAAYQYYGVSKSGNALKYDGAPMRGSYWFERMKAVHAAAILRGAAAVAAKCAASAPQIPEHQQVKTVLGLRRNPVFPRR